MDFASILNDFERSVWMLNFAVGPVMMEQNILDIASQQIPYFRTSEFSSIMLENEELLLRLIGAPAQSRVIFLTASGTAAMEAAVINVFNADDKILIVNGGSFGKRFEDICQIHGLNYETIKLDYCEPLSSNHLTPYQGKGFTGFLINAHETSTGVLYDMELVKDFCLKDNLILVVDAISTFMADFYDMQEWGANVTILSTQKGLALPPGMSMLVLDKLSQYRINGNHVNSLYLDMKNYLKDGERGQTPYTPAIGIILQLRERLRFAEKKSMTKIINDVHALAADFRLKIKSLPFDIAHNSLSNALTPIKPKGKMSANDIFIHLKNTFNIYVCPNGGELKDLLFRVGHLGSLTINDNERLIEVFSEMHKKGVL